MKTDESRMTAFPVSVVAGVVAMALADGFGWSIYPPTAFLLGFALTMGVLLNAFSNDAKVHEHADKTNEQSKVQTDLGI